MSEFVNLVEIQYRKRTRMKQKTSDNKFTMVDCTNVKDSFFWIPRHEEFVNNLLAETLTIGRDSKAIEVLENIKEQLLDIYNNALDREQKFLKDFTKNLDNKQFKISGSNPNIENYSANQTYANSFNNIIFTEFQKHTDSFKEMLNSEIFLDIISKKISTFSSTKGAELAGVEKEELMNDLINVFLVENKKTNIYRSYSYKGKGADKKITDKRLMMVLAKYYQFCKKYNMEEFSKALIQEIQNNDNEIINLISQYLDDMNISFYDNKRRRKTNGINQGKGISKNFERDLKNAFNRMSEAIIEKSAGALEFGRTYGPVKIEQRLQTSSLDYKAQVTFVLDSEKLDKDLSEEQVLPVDVFLNFIEAAIPEYSNKADIDISDLNKTFNKNKTEIKEIITRNLQKTAKELGEEVSIGGQKRLLRAYNRIHLKGLLGEITKAIYFQSMDEVEAQVTGAMSAKSGQLNYDIIVKINNNLYGFQIKNYSVNQQNKYTLYDEEKFSIKKDDAMEKYFGEDKQKYYYLFANHKMLEELGVVNNFDEKVAQSLYKYSDNFLRIAAGDLEGLDLKTSDAFFIADKIVPSSFLIATLYDSCKNQIKDNEKNNPMFSINSKEADYETMQSGVASKIHYINAETGRLGTAQISFKGITVDLNFKR